ncbi:farnesyl-pyrophosphate synthetase [Aspergillus ellipticus CBS 707.79]|uniref:Farnesyl-pyrophosphate synthetase n=1 Tax=Aspergillus ellipticus CBS 707.79 TaxID=1448320 RepID=A0A319D7D8_9EURO|nr:farnesyl-pyrophosphate synthetase [Aspergillus ellipticus CBS 707.79]
MQVLAEIPKGGKMTRCLMPLETGRRCLPGQLSSAQARDLLRLGWIVEMTHGAILMEDDMMDASIFRRGALCRHLQPNIGMTAIADARMLRTSGRYLLRLHFEKHPCYLQLLHLLNEMSFHVDLGQITDVHLASTTFLGFRNFELGTYNFLIRHKTAWYSFFLPVALASYYLQLPASADLAQAEKIMVAVGMYFQAQDDYLDLFGDPAVTGKYGNDVHERKLAWPIVEALRRCGERDKSLLEQGYSDGNVEQVKSVLESLGLPQIYEEFADRNNREIRGMIARVDESQGLKRELFELYLAKLYRRAK